VSIGLQILGADPPAQGVNIAGRNTGLALNASRLKKDEAIAGVRDVDQLSQAQPSMSSSVFVHIVDDDEAVRESLGEIMKSFAWVGR
jgi:hypothetical protein